MGIAAGHASQDQGIEHLRIGMLEGFCWPLGWGEGPESVPLSQLGSFVDKRPGGTIILVDLGSLDADQKIELIARIGRSNALRAIVMEPSAGSANYEGLLRAGFAGVLDRETSPEIFQRAIGSVSDGQLWFPREIISRVLKGFLIVEDLDRLTSREVEVLELIGDGLNNQQIANKLFISRETVRWHVRGLNAKLGIKDRNSAKEFLHHLQAKTPKFSNTSIESRTRSAVV